MACLLARAMLFSHLGVLAIALISGISPEFLTWFPKLGAKAAEVDFAAALAACPGPAVFPGLE
eukprot:888257-Lingulodinium_polyedra.AAC.1